MARPSVSIHSTTSSRNDERADYFLPLVKEDGKAIFRWSGSKNSNSGIESAWKQLDEDEKIEIGTPMEDADIGYQK